MGYITALDLKDNLPLADAMRVHLQHNHYPPVPVSMVPVCLRALKFAKRGDWDHNLRLPRDTKYRGKRLAPVSAVVEAHHLDAFMEVNDDL